MTITQKMMYTRAERRAADLNNTFFELVNHPTNPLVREDLEALIRHRPHIYGRFAGFLPQLPRQVISCETATE